MSARRYTETESVCVTFASSTITVKAGEPFTLPVPDYTEELKELHARVRRVIKRVQKQRGPSNPEITITLECEDPCAPVIVHGAYLVATIQF